MDQRDLNKSRSISIGCAYQSSILSQFQSNRKSAIQFHLKSTQCPISSVCCLFSSKSSSLSNNGGNSEITYVWIEYPLNPSYITTEWFITLRIYLVPRIWCFLMQCLSRLPVQCTNEITHKERNHQFYLTKTQKFY